MARLVVATDVLVRADYSGTIRAVQWVRGGVRGHGLLLYGSPPLRYNQGNST
jgi:hypothetical protein